MGHREPFCASVVGGGLAGWVDRGSAPGALLLHGGPGLNFEYLDGLAAELAADVRMAAFQQRGLEPSTLAGPFTVAQAIADVVAVLDCLEWPRAVLVGHSWGGYLALRVAATHPERVEAALAVDPVGIVGDGGRAAFQAELAARIPKVGRERRRLLDEQVASGARSPAEAALESLGIVWPAYFADPEAAPAMPEMQWSLEAYQGIMSDVAQGAADACAELALGRARYGVLSGAASPIPWGQAGRASAELSPAATFMLVPAAGHFPWLEAPGSVRAALSRLLQ